MTDPGPVPAETTRAVHELSDIVEAMSDDARRRVLHFLSGYTPESVNKAMDWIRAVTEQESTRAAAR